jgi:DNA-binding MarR family transcriptional regulator/GNAT superfamily N-acetyltransferase
MEGNLIKTVRSFNRTVIQRIGALNDENLSRDRPLGASRVLWDIDEGADVKDVRERLGLDAGYLSRLLRQLEAENLVRIRPAPYDHRVRFVELTKAGLAERAVLDQRSNEVAWSLLAPLNDHQQKRLLVAMATVENLLNVGLVELRIEDPTSKAAFQCMHAYFDELNARFEGGFTSERSLAPGVDDLVEPAGLLLVAFLHAEPIGCGALRFNAGGPAEIKRLWVSREVRGLGVGKRILGELEVQAQLHGARKVRLDTNRTLQEAIALYQGSGYREVMAFNKEPYAHHWFEKDLSRRSASSTSPRRVTGQKAPAPTSAKRRGG